MTIEHLAQLATASADLARDIHEIQHNLDVGELRHYFDKLARIVETQGRLLADLAQAQRVLVLPVKENPDAKATFQVDARPEPSWDGAFVERSNMRSAVAIHESSHGHAKPAVLELVDEGTKYRVRVREAHGKASIFLTDNELYRLGLEINYMRSQRAKRQDPCDATDDLARIECTKAGQVGHSGCGWCKEHNRPSFECLCNGARASVGDRLQGPICENPSCGLPVTHGESWHDGGEMRWWCDQHVPMSGHYEWCPTPCCDLVKAVTKPELWAVLAAGHAHLTRTK